MAADKLRHTTYSTMLPAPPAVDALRPWQGSVVPDERRITFVKARKPENAVASSASSYGAVRSAPGGVLAASRASSAAMFTPPVVPDALLQLGEWRHIRKTGPGLQNAGNTCYLNAVLQVCAPAHVMSCTCDRFTGECVACAQSLLYHPGSPREVPNPLRWQHSSASTPPHQPT